MYKVEDKILFDESKIVLRKISALCVHGIYSLPHYVLALEEGIDPIKFGLSKPEDRKPAYVQCVDLREIYAHDGTIIFRCNRTEGEISSE